MDNIGALIVPAVIALVAISIVAKGVRVVQQAQTMIIERLGRYHRTLSSGVNLIIPIIDKPRAIDWHQVIVTPAGDSFARHFRTEKIDLRETVSRVERKGINPPRDIRDAMEKQMRAERDRRAAILTAEAEKQSRTLQSEGIRQSEINQAEGQKQARILAAEAEANARLKVAEAEAQAIERITAAIKGTGGDPARYLIAIRYIEALKEMVTSPQSNKVVYLPYEATGVLASLGGIRDMLAGPSEGKKA